MLTQQLGGEKRKLQKECNYDEMMHWSDWDYWFGCEYEQYRVVYDNLSESLKSGTIIGDGRVEEQLKRFAIALERMEDVLLSDVVHKTTNWEEHSARWSNELESILRYERHCLRRKEVRQERCDRYEDERAHWGYAAENPSLCTFNGGWIFSSKNSSACIAMLTQQLGHESIV